MKKNIIQKIGIFSFSLLLALLSAYLYSPVVKSHADEAKNIKVKAEIDSIISVNASDANLEMGSDYFATGNASVNIDSNSKYGYSLYLEDLDENSDMKNQYDNSYVISSNFSGAKTSSTMEKNTWGYSIDGTDFLKIPIFGNPSLIKTTNSGSTDNVTVSFGAKVEQTMASGYYVDHVLFSAIANGQDGNPTGTVGSTTMQDFVCENIIDPSNSTSSAFGGLYVNKYVQKWNLRDTRNNKVYEIVQLADGNCWMLQNLDISGQEITKDNSALLYEDKDSFTIPPSLTTWSFSRTTPEVYSTNNADVGAYYNFAAASAGYNHDFVLDRFDDMYATYYGSICPSGWNLPSYEQWMSLVRVYLSTETYLRAITLSSEIDQLKDNGGDEAEIADKKNQLFEIMIQLYESTPLNLTRNGIYSVTENGLAGQGTVGAWWAGVETSWSSAKTIDTDEHRAFYLGVNYDDMSNMDDMDTRNGLNVRCIAEAANNPNNNIDY